MTKTKDSAEILQLITDTMMLWEGKDIAEKATEVLDHPVEYLGDDTYQIKEE